MSQFVSILETYLDILCLDVQRRVWDSCAYHKLTNPTHLLGDGSYFGQLRASTWCLILCADSDTDANPGTVILNEKCPLDNAIKIIQAVGNTVTELRLYAPVYHGTCAVVLCDAITRRCIAVRRLCIAWAWDESDELLELVCKMVRSIGAQMTELDIDSQPTIPAKVIECFLDYFP